MFLFGSRCLNNFCSPWVSIVRPVLSGAGKENMRTSGHAGVTKVGGVPQPTAIPRRFNGFPLRNGDMSRSVFIPNRVPHLIRCDLHLMSVVCGVAPKLL